MPQHFVSSLITALKTHSWALLLFVLLALLIESPLIAFPFVSGNAYQGINIPHFGTDVHNYLSRANDAWYGNGPGNPAAAMNKDFPDPTSSFVERVLAAPVRLLGLTSTINIVDYYNVLNFLGIIATLILMYAFVYELSGNKWLSAAAALCAVGGHSIIYHKSLFYTDFNIYGRYFFPYASSVPFFAFLFTAYRAIVHKMNYTYVIGAGVLFGVLWYDYFYAWSYTLALVGILFLIYATWRDWSAVKRILGIGLIGGLLGLPAFISIVQQHLSEVGDTVAYFYYAVHTHMFVMSWISVGVGLFLAGFAYFRRTDPAIPFMLGLVIAGAVAVNQQVITGIELDLGHYYWYFVVPLAILCGIYMVGKLIPHKKWQVYLAIAVIAISLINTIGGQYKSFPVTYKDKLHEQLYAPIMMELKQRPYGVVFADPASSPYAYLPIIYTKDDEFFNGVGLQYHIPFERVKNTLFISLYLDPTARSSPRKFLEDKISGRENDVYVQLFKYTEGPLSGLDFRTHTARFHAPDEALQKIRSEVLDQIVDEYTTNYANGNAVRKLLTDADVNYFIWDKTLYPAWRPTDIPGVTLLTDGPIALFSLQ